MKWLKYRGVNIYIYTELPFFAEMSVKISSLLYNSI